MQLNTLPAYKSWADDLLYRCLSDLTEGDLRQSRPMLFGNILSLLHHVYAMDLVWKSHLEGVPHSFNTRNPAVTISFSELRKKQREINHWFENYFSDLSSENHSQMISFNYIGGGAGAMTSAQIMQHVVNHSSYHRGHIEGVLYQLHIEPPATDLPVFLDGISCNEQR